MRSDEIFGFFSVFISENPGLLLLGLELAFWLLVALLTVLLVRFRPRILVATEAYARKIASHRRACVLGIFAFVILIRLSVLPFIPVPIAYMHDEFSYLLGADTFAHGRLTNPPHPMAVHFETFHVNMWPTYQSMYPPFQAAALALGQVVTGNPWIGVVFSVAAMCAVICWMLQAWAPPQWALLGGIFAVLRYGIFSYWINSYMGGAVAATGGALLLGAYPRLQKNPRLRYSLLFVTGLVILANSRPFEGMVFSLPLVLWALYSLARREAGKLRLLVSVYAPAILLFAIALVCMGYYNWRGTGSALRMPYEVNHATYHVTKPFLWQSRMAIPHYNHQSMRTVYVYWELGDYLNSKYADGLEAIMRGKAVNYYAFYLWPGLLLFVASLSIAFRDPKLRVVACAISCLGIGLFLQLWRPMPHYPAPAAGAIILVFISALRRIRAIRHSVWATWGSRALVISIAGLMIVPLSWAVINPYRVPESPKARTITPEIERDRLETVLEHTPGKHLVIVHYPWLGNWATMDWIYNRADIDKSKVVWARDMGFLDNRELLDYYADRHVWYVTRLPNMPVLVPYDLALTNWTIAAKYIPETPTWRKEQSSSELAQRASQPRTNF